MNRPNQVNPACREFAQNFVNTFVAWVCRFKHQGLHPGFAHQPQEKP